MAGVFPSDRNYRFSSSLLNLKFMKKAGGDADTASLLPRHSISGPALTQLEASRREVESRQQLPGTVIVEEEHSITRLFDLVVGRFSFRGINPVLEADLHSGDDSMEEGELENTDGKDVTDKQMADRSSVNDTVRNKFNRRGFKRPSDDLASGDYPARKRSNGEEHSQADSTDDKSNHKNHGRYFTSYGSRGGGRGQNKRRNFGRGGRRGGLPRD